MPFQSSSGKIMLLSSCHDHKFHFLLLSLCGNNEVIGFLILKWYILVVLVYVLSKTKEIYAPDNQKCGNNLNTVEVIYLASEEVIVILFCKHTIMSQNIFCKGVT